jgi:hypothetical protein
MCRLQQTILVGLYNGHSSCCCGAGVHAFHAVVVAGSGKSPYQSINGGYSPPNNLTQCCTHSRTNSSSQLCQRAPVGY